jgi:CHAD domain-containing protein
VFSVSNSRKLGWSSMRSATDQSRDAGESVSGFATIQLKESFAVLFCDWRNASGAKDETEPVHQLRVSSRRVRAAIELFADLLPCRKSQRLLDTLDDLRKSAGPVRDSDVFLGRLAREKLDPGIRQTLVEYLQVQRRKAHARLSDYYNTSDAGEDLEQKAMNLLMELRPRGRRSKKLDHRFSDWVENALQRLTRTFFKSAKIDTEQLECLHQLRIRSKQFRYTLDILQPLSPSRQFNRAYSGLKKLAQRLGKINDHSTAVEILAGLQTVDFPKPVRQYLSQWQKKERRALRHSIAEFADWWTSGRRRRMRRRLKKASTSPDLSLGESSAANGPE